MRITVTLDMEIEQPFSDAEQERYFLASIEQALETETWHDLLANKETAPQQPMNVRARMGYCR